MADMADMAGETDHELGESSHVLARPARRKTRTPGSNKKRTAAKRKRLQRSKSRSQSASSNGGARADADMPPDLFDKVEDLHNFDEMDDLVAADQDMQQRVSCRAQRARPLMLSTLKQLSSKVESFKSTLDSTKPLPTAAVPGNRTRDERSGRTKPTFSMQQREDGFTGIFGAASAAESASLKLSSTCAHVQRLLDSDNVAVKPGMKIEQSGVLALDKLLKQL